MAGCGAVRGASPTPEAEAGRYHLIRKGQPLPEDGHVYRLSHPLGEHVLDAGRRHDTPVGEITFTLAGAPQRIAALEQLPSRSGWLELNLLELESFQLEEHLVFSAQADDGQWLDAEACQRLLELPGRANTRPPAMDTLPPNFDANVRRHLETINKGLKSENAKLNKECQDHCLTILRLRNENSMMGKSPFDIGVMIERYVDAYLKLKESDKGPS